jgi:hypothetical protein
MARGRGLIAQGGRLCIAAACLALGLGGCDRAAIARHWQPPPPCAPFDQISIQALSPTQDSADGASFAAAWETWATHRSLAPWPSGQHAADAEIVLDSSRTASPAPAAYEVRARRWGADWRVLARRRSLEDGLGAWTGWTSAPVSAQTASDLDATLNSACLWSAPSFLDKALPVIHGAPVPCVDGPVSLLDVRSHNRRWGGMQVCWVLGAPGRLRADLMHTAFGEPAATMDAAFRSRP